jgi:hypothetical protein
MKSAVIVFLVIIGIIAIAQNAAAIGGVLLLIISIFGFFALGEFIFGG